MHQFHLLKLLQIPQMGAQRIARLLAEVDFDEFCRYDRKQLQHIGWNEKQIFRWFHPEQKWLDRALQWAEKDGQRLLTLFDDDYPFLLRQIGTAPPILFVRGNVAALSQPQIAMVGSRDYSNYGEYWAGRFAQMLAENGLAVTSGLAIGIDGFCHRAALEADGTTIAVLGSGLDQVYPARHKKLAADIVEKGGALVSEFFPDQPPLAENFPRRNRIISGLSLGTLVVEATVNSGSLITARYALEQGREVFALPNAVQNPYSQGCHKLIKDGALLVENIDDILNAVALQRQPAPQQKGLFEAPSAAARKAVVQAVDFVPKSAKKIENLTAIQQQLVAHMSLEPISIDDLAEAAQTDIQTALVELLALELCGAVKQITGGYVRN